MFHCMGIMHSEVALGVPEQRSLSPVEGTGLPGPGFHLWPLPGAGVSAAPSVHRGHSCVTVCLCVFHLPTVCDQFNSNFIY